MNHRILIARRMLGGKGFTRLSSSNLLSLIGIALGVFSIIVVSSVMNGFDNYMMDSVINFKSNIWVTRSDNKPFTASDNLLTTITDINGVTGVSPVCKTDLMIQNEGVISSVQCIGVDLNRHKDVTKIIENIRVGKPDAEEFSENGIILGLELSMFLRATVGEKIRLTSPLSTIPTPFGLVPRSKDLEVSGLFNAGLPEYDKSVVFIGLEQCRFYKGYTTEIDLIEIKTKNPYTSRKIAEKISKIIGSDYKVEDWSQFDSNLFTSIRIEKFAIMFVLSLMFLLVAINMSGSFIKTITEKKKDIGILKTIGVTDSDLSNSVVFMAGIVGITGSLLGGISASLMMFLQQELKFIKIPVRGFPFQSLPSNIHWADVIFTIAVAILISLLSAWYPAKRTLNLKPINMIRNRRD